MTPDKVEAALGVLRGGRRSPHCDESRPAGIVFVGEEVSAYDHALSVLTEALAERGWRPIESAPRDSRVMFVVRAFNAEVGPGRLYTSDPWCVWADGGTFVRWPHPFQPTHWQPLPEPPHDR